MRAADLPALVSASGAARALMSQWQLLRSVSPQGVIAARSARAGG